MPRRNATKPYIESTYYHVYNRGVDKEPIFRRDQDYRYFTNLLNYYLTPNKAEAEAEALLKRRRWRPEKNDLSKDVELISYCLMPNHYHLLIQQMPDDGLTKLMKRVSASYSLYYNNCYGRVGHVFESSCKARMISNDYDFIGTSVYIHRNPRNITQDFENYKYSNMKDIRSGRQNNWTNTSGLLGHFNQNAQDYVSFVCQKKGASLELLTL